MDGEFSIRESAKEIIEEFVNNFGLEKKILKGELDDKIRLVQYPIGDDFFLYVIEFDGEAIGSVFEDDDSCIITSYYSGRNYGENTGLAH